MEGLNFLLSKEATFSYLSQEICLLFKHTEIFLFIINICDIIESGLYNETINNLFDMPLQGSLPSFFSQNGA